MNVLFITKDVDFIAPIGLMYVAAVTKKAGHKTDLCVLDKEDLFAKIESFNPDVIAYSSTTGEHMYYLEINKLIKVKYNKIFTIMGGSHPTFFPEVLKESSLDAICIGEGEVAFVKMLDRLSQGKDLTNVKSIVTRSGDTKRINGKPVLEPLIQKLDELPFPDRDIFYENKAVMSESVDGTIKIMNFVTSRGCPYNCSYCFNHALKNMYPGEKFVRKHSIDNVLKQLSDAKRKFNFQFIRFNDDIFVMRRRDELEELAERYPKEVGVPFYIHCRFDIIKPITAKLLKKAGCVIIQMSIESPNEKLRKHILHRPMDNAKIKEGVDICHNAGLNVLAYSMLGLPTSSIQDDIDVVDFCINNRIKLAQFPIFAPYPKTEITDYAIKKGYFDGDFSSIEMYLDAKKSKLSQFSEKEKNIQLNIQTLGPIVLRYPWLRNIVLNWLIYWPPNKIFERISIFDKLITYQTEIYRRKYSFKERMNLFFRGLGREKVKRGTLTTDACFKIKKHN